MKTTIVAYMVVISTIFNISAQESPTKPVAVTGSWKVKNTEVVWTITADSKLTTSNGSSATWKANPDSSLKYDVTWGGKAYTLEVDPLGKAIALTNADGKTIEAERVPDKAAEPVPVDPIIGSWRIAKGAAEWTFKADGTVNDPSSGFSGVWKQLKSSTIERKYEIVWQGGKLKSAGEMSSTGRKIMFLNSDSPLRLDFRQVEE